MKTLHVKNGIDIWQITFRSRNRFATRKDHKLNTTQPPGDGTKLSDNDRQELEKFSAFLHVEASRRAGGNPSICNMLEAAVYPEGIGRIPADGVPES